MNVPQKTNRENEISKIRYADEVAIGELSLAENKKIHLVYDFGDNWEFEINLESINPESKIKKLRLVEKKGKAPVQYPSWD